MTLAAEDRGWPRDRREARLGELLELTQMPCALLPRYPAEPERRPAAAHRAHARAHARPRGALLDEPLAALDPMIRADLQRDLRSVFERLHKTVLLVTHDIGEAAAIGDEIAPDARRTRRPARELPRPARPPRRPVRHRVPHGVAAAGLGVVIAPALAVLLLAIAAPAAAESRVAVGSKAFAESWIRRRARRRPARRGHRARGVPLNLGGTEIVLCALRSGSVDVYPEYTGTIQEVVLQSPRPLAEDEMRAALAAKGLGMSRRSASTTATPSR